MTIVVGYVPTPEGEAALTAAISEAQLREEPLHIVNSSRGDSLATSATHPRTTSTRSAPGWTETGVAYEIHQLVRGHEASEELVEAADRIKASLIVIGLRRRTATGKLLTGSQAQRILLDANCPVLAVKAAH